MNLKAKLLSVITWTLLTISANAADAWTTPVTLSQSGDQSCSIPSIARTSSGKLLSAYRRKTPSWQILYRERSAGGFWGAVDTVSQGTFSEREDVFEDSQGRPHMFFTSNQYNAAQDLIEAYKGDTGWVLTPLTNTSDRYEDYPRAALDSSGRIHLVYTRTNNASDQDHGDIIYRLWNGSSWSAEQSLGSVSGASKFYYGRPDISVDSGNNVHVVWLANSTTMVYRRYSGASWSGQQTIGAAANFLSYPRISAATSNQIAAVVFEQLTASQPVINAVTSSNGGVSWGIFAVLDDGHYPQMTHDSFGNANLVYQGQGGGTLRYRTFNGTWSAAQTPAPTSGFQGWPDVVVDSGGVTHIVYDSDSASIAYVNSSVDVLAPANPSPFTASPSDSTVVIAWTNPTDPDFTGTVVRFSTTAYPTGPNDGTLLTNQLGAPSSTGTFTHSSLTNGTTYYYRVFSYDGIGNTSSGASAQATPQKLTCLGAKNAPDGSFISLADKIVTALFSSDSALYVQEPNRSSGIRISINPAGLGLVLGDHVNITGTIGNRVVSGYTAERVITGASVVKVQPAVPLSPPTPLAMDSMTLGGEASGLQPGVTGGVGLNSIGLLVRYTGRVTGIITSSVFVDDGGGVIDPIGSAGVLIKCPNTQPPVVVNNMVAVTGVIVGSISSGEIQNRRLIQMRDYATDLVILGSTKAGILSGTVSTGADTTATNASKVDSFENTPARQYNASVPKSGYAAAAQ